MCLPPIRSQPSIKKGKRSQRQRPSTNPKSKPSFIPGTESAQAAIPDPEMPPNDSQDRIRADLRDLRNDVLETGAAIESQVDNTLRSELIAIAETLRATDINIQERSQLILEFLESLSNNISGLAMRVEQLENRNDQATAELRDVTDDHNPHRRNRDGYVRV